MAIPLELRSSLPGRVRWYAPWLRGRPAVAAAVARDLDTCPGLLTAAANAVTGSILLTTLPEIAADQTRAWLEHVIDRVLSRPAEALVADAHREPVSEANGDASLGRLLARARKHGTLANATIGVSFLNRLFEATPPIMIGTAVDVVTRRSGSVLGALGLKTVSSQLVALGGFSLVLWAADAASGYLQNILASELANRVRHDLRVDLYRHLQSLDVAQIEARGVSDWMMLLDEDIRQVHRFIENGADPIVTIAANGVIVASSFAMLAPQIGLAQLVAIPPLVAASTRLLDPIQRRHAATRVEADAVAGLLHGNVAGMATIAAYGTEDREADRLDAASERHLDRSREASRMSAAYVPTLQMIVGGGFITTLLWGGALVNQGRLAAGAYNVMGFSELRLLVALGGLGMGLEAYTRTKVSLDRIFSVLDMKPAIASGEAPLADAHGDLALEDVTFGYEDDRQILRGLSMSFPARRTTGIVGATGAGKSTILKLLLRFYDVQDGTVRIGGQDVREVRLDDLRAAFGMVPQDVVLFSGSIRDNIAYARPDASLDEVRAAARMAEADAFIDALPDGYDTRIGYGARSLSTGQRQRIVIARAVLADRPILLFDEATSALDSETEASIQRSLRAFTENRTTIIVAHRLSTIRHADVIYVIDDGDVRESGTHDALVAEDGIYASLWRVQTGERPAPAPRTRAPKAPASRRRSHR
ncbi:MAG: ATP-binding cassette domain-containing protein [Vicinamibacterales bacterium]